MMSYQFLTLVLEEDGTVVDSEEFFQSLPNSTLLMVLEKGEMWTESKVRAEMMFITAAECLCAYMK